MEWAIAAPILLVIGPCNAHEYTFCITCRCSVAEGERTFYFSFFIATVCVANKDVNTAAKIHISACYQLAISSKASPISTAS